MNLKDILGALGKNDLEETEKLFLAARKKENWERVKKTASMRKCLKQL